MLWLAIILALGVGSQWVAWLLRIPSILMLLLVGFLVGPVARAVTPQWFGQSISVDPNALLDSETLVSLVSLAVGFILFEGGLSLNFRDVSGVRRVIFKLVTVGAAVTWVIASLAGHFILGLQWKIAILLGAVLIVTGPTVIGPLLRYIRPTGKSGSVLRWEGIIIDPIGAMVSVLAFEVIALGISVSGQEWSVASGMLHGAAVTILVGASIGAVAALLLARLITRFWVPDYLQVPIVIASVTAAFASSNALAAESGLFCVTVMGMVMANLRNLGVHHIVEFKETLTSVFIAILFIVLSARVEIDTLRELTPASVLFVLALVLVARPLSVVISTIGSTLSWRERLFLSWMAPRGIVAAAVASVFALRLHALSVPDAHLLVPYVFLVIVSTVALYGLTAGWLARKVRIAHAGNAGFLIIGASALNREIAAALHREGLEVLLVDTNVASVREARLAGLPVIAGNALASQVSERIELSGIGRLLALTSNDELNSLAAVHYGRVFGRSGTFQLAERERSKQRVHHDLTGRKLFGNDMSWDEIQRRVESGATIRKTLITAKFGLADYLKQYGPTALPMFVVSEHGEVSPVTAESQGSIKPGHAVIGLVQHHLVHAVEQPVELAQSK